VAQRLLDKGYLAENILVLWKGYFHWLELGYPVVADAAVQQ